MSIIYQPKGKAREYSPLAANLYLGCNHGCKYCYAPSIRFQTRQDFKIIESKGYWTRGQSSLVGLSSFTTTYKDIY